MHKILLNKFYFIDKFKKSNIDKQDKYTTIIYRNYKKDHNIKDIILLRNYCRIKKIKFFLSNNIRLSIKFKLDGAYIPSFNKDLTHLNYKYEKKFILIGSAHNLKEIKIKEKQNVKKIFISSLFKKNKNFLGLNKFKLTSRLTKNEIIALGGISKNNIKLIELTDAVGFAGISYFEAKKRPHR
tara:strand:- start:237 stop:785 length:549 start_codon:yes stop_codon:yes gene_type:complete